MRIVRSGARGLGVALISAIENALDVQFVVEHKHIGAFSFFETSA
jgi:hypothetical protein